VVETVMAVGVMAMGVTVVILVCRQCPSMSVAVNCVIHDLAVVDFSFSLLRQLSD